MNNHEKFIDFLKNRSHLPADVIRAEIYKTSLYGRPMKEYWAIYFDFPEIDDDDLVDLDKLIQMTLDNLSKNQQKE